MLFNEPSLEKFHQFACHSKDFHLLCSDVRRVLRFNKFLFESAMAIVIIWFNCNDASHSIRFKFISQKKKSDTTWKRTLTRFNDFTQFVKWRSRMLVIVTLFYKLTSIGARNNNHFFSLSLSPALLWTIYLTTNNENNMTSQPKTGIWKIETSKFLLFWQ